MNFSGIQLMTSILIFGAAQPPRTNTQASLSNLIIASCVEELPFKAKRREPYYLGAGRSAREKNNKSPPPTTLWASKRKKVKTSRQ